MEFVPLQSMILCGEYPFGKYYETLKDLRSSSLPAKCIRFLAASQSFLNWSQNISQDSAKEPELGPEQAIQG